MYIIAYDICDDKRLRKIAKILEQSGVRTQRSIFEIETQKTAIQLFKEIEEIMEKEDKCFLMEYKEKEDIQTKTRIERII